MSECCFSLSPHSSLTDVFALWGQLGLLGRYYPWDFFAPGLDLPLCMAAQGWITYCSFSASPSESPSCLLGCLMGKGLLCLWPPHLWSFSLAAPFPSPALPKTFIVLSLFNISFNFCHQVGLSFIAVTASGPCSNNYSIFSWKSSPKWICWLLCVLIFNFPFFF